MSLSNLNIYNNVLNGLTIGGGTGSLSNLTINSNGVGISVVGVVGLNLSGITVRNNGFGIYVLGAVPLQEPSFENINIYDNVTYGLFNDTPQYEGICLTYVSAINNWWGSVTGPNHWKTNWTGTGNPVSDCVIYTPWSFSPN